jgi:AGZA family xanthine/uracil permease-like MFS transporter
VGIGAGFVSWVFIRVLRQKWAEIHWLMWVVTIAFAVYFANAWILTIVH